MSSVGKRKQIMTLDDGQPPPNISIGAPTDPEEKKKFQERLRQIKEQAALALEEPFSLKPHTLQQPLNSSSKFSSSSGSNFSVNSLVKNKSSQRRPVEVQNAPVPPRPNTSPQVPQLVGVPLSCINSRSCASAFPLKIEGLGMNGGGNSYQGGVSLTSPGSSLTTPIPFISCSPNSMIRTNVSPLSQVFSPVMPLQSISPLALTSLTPVIFSPPNMGNSPHSMMAQSDVSSGYRTGSTSSKGQRSEYTVGQLHPKPPYLRVEDGDSEEEYFEDSSSSGRVTPVNCDEDDELPSAHVLVDGHLEPPVKTDGQPSGIGNQNGHPSTIGSRNNLTNEQFVEDEYIDAESVTMTTPHTSAISANHLYVVSSSSATRKDDSHTAESQQGSGTGERPSSGVSSMSSDASVGSISPDIKSEISPTPGNSEVFCHVPGRLSLLSATPKYKVTVEEIKRRLSYPESLNASILGGILRRAKSKNGGHLLRQKLESIGVKLPPGKRKTSELTLLTALVEGEARHLATDYQRVTQRDFPSNSIAQHIAKKRLSTHSNTKDHIRAVKAAKQLIKELVSLMHPSINAREWPENSDTLAQGLTRYSLLTHSFGPLAMTTALDATLGCLDNLQAIYEGSHKKPNGEPSSYFSQQQQLQQQQQQQQQHQHLQQPGNDVLPLATREKVFKCQSSQHPMKLEVVASSDCPILMPTHFE